MKAHFIGGVAHGQIVEIAEPYLVIRVPKMDPLTRFRAQEDATSPADIPVMQVETYYRTTNRIPGADIYEYKPANPNQRYRIVPTGKSR